MAEPVSVFITYSTDVPKEWLSAIDTACRWASNEDFLFQRDSMDLAQAEKKIDQNYFFERIKSARIYIFLVNTEWTSNCEREYDLAMELMQQGDLQVHLVGKKYKKEELGFEKAEDIYNNHFRKTDETQEQRDSNGRYFRFGAVNELTDEVTKWLNHYKDQQNHIEKERKNRLLLLGIVAVACLLLWLYAHSVKEKKTQAYLRSMANVERLVGICTESSLAQAKDSLLVIDGKYDDSFKDKPRIKALLEEISKKQDSLKRLPPPIPDSTPDKSKALARDQKAVFLSGENGLPTDWLAEALNERGYKFRTADIAKWKAVVSETPSLFKDGDLFCVRIKYSVSLQDLSQKGTYSQPFAVTLQKSLYKSSIDYEQALGFARKNCAGDISQFIINKITK